jgi:hypothetical protein
VHVACGSVADLGAGDALEATGEGELTLTAGAEGAELVVVTTT